MSQIEKKNQEFVKTNSHVLEDTTNQEFGYWKSLKDISSEDDYNRFLKQSEHNVDNGLSRRNFLSSFNWSNLSSLKINLVDSFSKTTVAP